jgi:hypothetical protein
MVSNPIAEVLRALTPLADTDQKNRPPEDPEFHQAFFLRNDVKNLEMMQNSKILSAMNMTERQWLTRIVEEQEKRIAVLAPHADLVRNQ